MKRATTVGLLIVLAASITTVYAEPFSTDNTSSERRFKLGPSLDEYEDSLNLNDDHFEYDKDKWNQMRKDLEEGREPGALLDAVDVSSATADAPKPPPGQIKVDLPYESSLSVTGRKVIRVELKNTHITDERAEEIGGSQDTQSFTMDQELQAKIQGTVARKTTINVNFDDTKENVRDFSVIYKGDPDEVVQEAAFGDITLSLPATEFVNYNKQLFGIRTALKYKKAGLLAIGSKTKGTTETKRFTGTTTRNQTFINDTNYIRLRYYDLTFSTAPEMTNIGGPLNGLTPVQLSQNATEIVLQEDSTSDETYTVAVPTSPSTIESYKMRRLSPGVDYVIDRVNNRIEFTNPLPESAHVAIDYELVGGQRLGALAGANAVIIKDGTPEGDRVSQEIKLFYFSGSRNIVQDDGLGNFLLAVFDTDRESEIGQNMTPVQSYPCDRTNGTGICINFETGVFELLQPFGTLGSTNLTDVYAKNVNSGSPLHSVFKMEYYSILRTFTLRPNIVLQSEVVEVDGRRVNRDLDYFIDYDIGLLTFFNDDLIREATVIEVTYEFAPFGGQLGETLVGVRGTYDIYNNKKNKVFEMEKWDVGSTVLYNFAAKPSGPPDIRSTPSSLLVTEGDTNVTGLKFGKIPLVTDFGIEAAKSSEDPNLYGKAIVDSFEGVKQEDQASMIEESWEISSNPPAAGFNTVSDFRGNEPSDVLSHVRWTDVDVQTFDREDDDATQKGLNITYRLNPEANGTYPQEQVSILNAFSTGGRDFSKKSTLEVEIQGAGGAGAGVDMIIDYGKFNEDADGDGIFDTEDTLPFDGILNLGEDTGWTYNGPGSDLDLATTGDNVNVLVGQANARLDSEDLNNDRVMTPIDEPATNAPLFRLSSTYSGTTATGTTIENISDLSFTGRVLFQIPLNVSNLTPDEQAKLTGVRQVRVTLRNTNASSVPREGSVILARVSMVGITWEPPEVFGGAGLSTMTVQAINSKDDSTYTSLIGNPGYNDLYQDATPSADAKEQALALGYFLQDNSTATTVNKYGSVRDFSTHRQFRFFLRKRDVDASSTEGTFFLRAGSETEYQQVNVPIDLIPARTEGGNTNWLMVSLEQEDFNNDGIPDTWVSDNPNITVDVVGNTRSLQQISEMKAGVVNTTGGDIQNEIWLNEMYVGEPNDRVGHAKKYKFDSSYPNWADFGASYREVDRHWQTPTTAITNRDQEQESAYLRFNRLKFLPMTFDTSREKTITPSAFQASDNALVSVIEEGEVETRNNRATANLLIPKLPTFNFTASNNIDDNKIQKRKQTTDKWDVTASYSPPIKPDFLPTSKLTFRALPTSLTFIHAKEKNDINFGTYGDLVSAGISTTAFSSTDLVQFSETNEVRMAFNFWNGFNFNPTYRLKVDEEQRTFREDEKMSTPGVLAIDGVDTPRSMEQKVTASGNLKLLRWLDPRYRYSYSGIENNNLPTLNNTTGYLLKTLTRNSEGELSAAIQMIQILPKTRLFNTMNHNMSYKVENGDRYENLPDSFDWQNKLWVGTPLDVSSGTVNARRTDATDRRTFLTNMSWLPWSAYTIQSNRLKPLNNLSITTNYLSSNEDTEKLGTITRKESRTWPDLIMTINDSEDFFNIKRMIDASRLVLKTNTRKTTTINISKSVTDTYETDYQFKFIKKFDVSANANIRKTVDTDFITPLSSAKTDVIGYSLQTRIPKGAWSYTPRYEHSETDSKDGLRTLNDLTTDTYTLQIYGDITKPLGIRFGRREFGVANRLIVNSSVQYDKKRSNVNPSTNWLDTYSANLSGDYTLSKNFRLAFGGNFAIEQHHPDFQKLDQTVFGLNSTLTIQF